MEEPFKIASDDDVKVGCHHNRVENVNVTGTSAIDRREATEWHRSRYIVTELINHDRSTGGRQPSTTCSHHRT